MIKDDAQQGDAMPTLSDDQLAPVGMQFLPDGQTLDISGTISIGAAWDPSARGTSGWTARLSRKVGADLDNVAVLVQDGQPVMLCAGWDPGLMDPMHGQPGAGSVVHSGDNTNGDGEGDDETITLHLDKIPGEITRIVVQVAAFKGKNKADKGFQGANNVLFSVYDGAGASARREFCLRPSLIGRENCVFVAVLDRVMTADGRATINWKLAKGEGRVNVKHGDQEALIRAAANAR